jgi:hypothetical protein
MSATKLFKETVRLRIEPDRAFRLALLQEVLSVLHMGDITFGKTMLQD